MTKNDNNKMEKIMAASPETLSLIITEEECYLVLKALDLYSRIWIGQYDRIDDLSIYDTGDKWNQNSVSHMLFQQIRDLLIPYLTGRGDYTCCSLGIWSDKTDIRAINAYDIQQRLRYEVSWYKNPEGDITVNYDKPWIRGDLGDFSVFCHRNDDDVIVTLYLSEEQLKTIQTALEVLRLLIRREIKPAFMFFTSNEEALSVAEELTKVYKGFEFRSFLSDKDYGRKIYGDLISKTAMLMERINKTSEAKAYVEYIRVNVPPANPFIPFEEAMKILDQSFEHFKKTRRKIPPNDVLNYPGAGFLTKVIGRERSTTDYLLVWYEGKTRTEYYYVGEDFLFKHGGQIEIPRDIKEYIRLKCKKGRIMGKEIDTTIKVILNQMNDLGQEAYYEYLGPVEKLCDNENASENEVGLMLDYLFDFCGNDKVLGLYKKVCRTFYKKYPGCIAEYIMQYRMEYDTEPSDY